VNGIPPGRAASTEPAGMIGDAAARDLVWAFARQSEEHAILLMAPDATIVWSSPGAAKVLGAEAAAIAGQPSSRFFVPEDLRLGIPEHEIAVATSRGAAEDNRWMQRADGSRFWASGMTVALHGDDGRLVGFAKVMRNLTDLKMRIETLEARAEAMAEADGIKAGAIATIAHEMRNPLSSLGMATGLLRRLAGSDPKLQPLLSILERNIEFADRLVNDLQDASRAGARKLELFPERLSLEDLLRSSIETAQQRTPDAVRIIELLLPPGAAITVTGDPVRLQQVFVNLLLNAIKYTHDHGRIWVKGNVHGRWLVVRIADNGIGIAPEMLKRIFQMFTQVSTPMAHAGLGIGLALVKEIVELHGGSVEARSDGLERGSDFVVRLPLEIPALPERPA
jgi:PAS domain S-box-containing protein